MRSADIIIGGEYEVTAQANPSPGGYPSRFEPSRVKVLSAPGGRFKCQYLDNPYSWSVRNRPRPGTTITLAPRSLIRPWHDVVAEKEEQQHYSDVHDRQVEQADRAAGVLARDLPEFEIESYEVIRIDNHSDGSPRPIVEMRLPLDVLLALRAKLEQHPGLTPVAAAEQSSLAELL